MARTLFEVTLLLFTAVLALEVVHYRNAVLDANADRKRAWNTVVELRRQNAGEPPDGAPPVRSGPRMAPAGVAR